MSGTDKRWCAVARPHRAVRLEALANHRTMLQAREAVAALMLTISTVLINALSTQLTIRTVPTMTWRTAYLGATRGKTARSGLTTPFKGACSNVLGKNDCTREKTWPRGKGMQNHLGACLRRNSSGIDRPAYRKVGRHAAGGILWNDGALLSLMLGWRSNFPSRLENSRASVRPTEVGTCHMGSSLCGGLLSVVCSRPGRTPMVVESA